MGITQQGIINVINSLSSKNLIYQKNWKNKLFISSTLVAFGEFIKSFDRFCETWVKKLNHSLTGEDIELQGSLNIFFYFSIEIRFKIVIWKKPWILANLVS